MTSTQKTLGIAIIVLVPLLRLFLGSSSDAQYELWIDQAGYAIQTPLVSSNFGLQGADLNRIEVNPKDRNQLVAAGYSSAYFSRDGGNTWQELRLGQSLVPYTRPVSWGPDGQLYVVWGSVLSVSEDGAKTWKEYSDESLFQLGVLADGSLWGRTRPDNYSRVKLQDGRIEIGEPLTEVQGLGVVNQRESRIILDNHEVAAGITKLDNGDEWAATAGGSYLRPAGQTEWQMRSEGQSNLNALYVRQSPLDPKQLLMLDSARRLWRSSDFGGGWSLADVGVQSARFNPEAEAVLVYADGRVTEDGIEIKPPKAIQEKLALRDTNFPEMVDEYLSEMAYIDAGRTSSGEFWILTSRFGSRQRQNYDNPFQRVAREWYLMDSNSLLVEKDGQWETRLGVELRQLEPGPDIPNLKPLAQGSGLSYKGEEISNHFMFVGLPRRGGWLIPNDRYFMVGEWGLQFGWVSAERALEPAVAWSWSYAAGDDLERGVLRPEESLISMGDTSLQLLVPGANGIWRAEVPIDEGWNWRWFAYMFTFSVWVWILWAGFLVAFAYRWRRDGA
jgi:hypothetical protein